MEEKEINANHIGKRDDQVNIIILNVQDDKKENQTTLKSKKKNIPDNSFTHYECNICKKSFEQPQYLSRHIKVDHEKFLTMKALKTRGIKLPEYIEMLKTRFFQNNDTPLPKDTLYVFPKRDSVSEYNA